MKTEESTELGTLVHFWKETGDTAPSWAKPVDTRTLEKKILLSGIERDDWWKPHEGQHEVTFALNPFTRDLVVYGGTRGGADDWKKRFRRDRWLTGTIDWLFHSGDIDDLKTGAWLVDPRESKQLRSYALIPWAMRGFPSDWLCNVSITQWPKYPLGELPTRTYHQLTGLDLSEHLDDVRYCLEHPLEVNVLDLSIDTGKLHPCSGCECRETWSGSEWMQNFWYRTLPHCTPGMMQRIHRAHANGTLQIVCEEN